MGLRADLAAGDLGRALAGLRGRLSGLTEALERGGGSLAGRARRPKEGGFSGGLARSVVEAARGDSLGAEGGGLDAGARGFGRVKGMVRARLRKGQGHGRSIPAPWGGFPGLAFPGIRDADPEGIRDVIRDFLTKGLA